MFVKVGGGRYVNMRCVEYIYFMPVAYLDKERRGIGKIVFRTRTGQEIESNKEVTREIADAVIKYIIENDGKPLSKIVDLDKVINSIELQINKGFVRADKLVAVDSS